MGFVSTVIEMISRVMAMAATLPGAGWAEGQSNTWAFSSMTDRPHQKKGKVGAAGSSPLAIAK